MKSQQQERHVLIINSNKGKQAIALEAAAYSLGRDLTNAIVLDFDTVSRQHAILLRVPIPGTTLYRYRLVDGNTEGKPSTNGVFVNGQRCSNHELVNGDMIGFGKKIKASYLSVAMEESEFVNYLESIKYQSIKSKQVSHKETLVGIEFSETSAVELNLRELVLSTAESGKNTHAGMDDFPDKGNSPDPVLDLPPVRNPTVTETLHESNPGIAPVWKLGILVSIFALLGLGAFGWFHLQSRQSPTPTTPAQPSPRS